MAYVQEIVVNALLECVHDELRPCDDHLLKSLDTLRAATQRGVEAGRVGGGTRDGGVLSIGEWE